MENLEIVNKKQDKSLKAHSLLQYQDKTLKLFLDLSKALLLDRKTIRQFELKKYSLQIANYKYNSRKRKHNILLKRLAIRLNINQINLVKYFKERIK